MKKTISFLGGILISISLFISTSFAEGFAITDFSARGTSLAGGLIGRANDASAVAYNPAGITQLQGTHVMLGATLVIPKVTIETIGFRGRKQSTTNKKSVWPHAHAYLTQQLNEKLWLGFGLFSRFGLGEKYPHTWPGRINIVKVHLQTLSLNPNIAFKFTDNFSMAVGLDIMGAKMSMEKDMYFRRKGFNRNHLKGKSLSFGGNIAAHYTFDKQWAAGLTYRSRIKHTIKGTSTFDKHYVTLNGSIIADANAYGKLNLPDVISGALTYTPIPELSIEVDTTYTLWSVYKNLDIRLKNPANITSKNPKSWKNTWTFSGSVEYQTLPWLALRAGYSYETSPINLKHADYMAPSHGRHRISIGSGFSIDELWKIDLAYSFIIINELEYKQSAKHTLGVLPGKAHKGKAHVIALSLGYVF